MALVVETTSVVTNSTTITKPTGVVSGDLLVLAIGSNGSSSRPGTFPTVSGFTTGVTALGGVANGFINTNSSSTLLWRNADSSDVDASTYTMSQASAASMFRISGWTGGNPLFAISDFETTSPTTTLSVTDTLKRETAQILIMCATAELVGVTTASTYQITSTDSSPSWTEVQDVNFDIGSRDKIQAVAYANSSDISNITNWGLTFSRSTASAVSGFLIVIAEPQNVTSDVSPFAIPPTINGVVATNNVALDVGHIQNAPTIGGTEAKADSKVWNKEARPAGTWVNDQK